MAGSRKHGRHSHGRHSRNGRLSDGLRSARGRIAAIAIVATVALTAALVVPLMPRAAAEITDVALAFSAQPADGAPNTALADIKVKATDTDDNAVEGYDISLTLQEATTHQPPATFSCAQDTVETGSDGIATFTGCKVSRGGTFTLTASDTEQSSVTPTTSTGFTISGPAYLVMTGVPATGTPATAWSSDVTVTVKDAGGSTVMDSTASVFLGVVSANITPIPIVHCDANPVSAVSGVATFKNCAIDKAGTFQVAAYDAADKAGSASASVTLNAGAATKLVFTTQPFGAAGGVAFATQPVVAVQDAAGNTVTTNTDQITLSITSETGTAGAALTCPPVHAVSGVATFTGCKIDKSGTGYTLTATDSASSLSGTSSPFAVTSGGASTITFSTPPSGGAAGAAFGTQPEIRVTDSGGNGLAAPVTLAIKSGTGTSGATLTCDANPVTSDASGAADFTGCRIDRTGENYQLTATVGAQSADSATFDVTAGPVASLAFTTQPGGGAGGTAWATQPVIAVTDAGGQPAGGSVTLAITKGMGPDGATLTCTVGNPLAASGGAATFAGCTIDKAGTYRLTATSGTAVATSEPFTVTTGAPARLAFSAQPGGGTGGIAWQDQPVVEIQDAGGNLVTTGTANVALTITTGTGSGTLTCSANQLPAVRGVAAFSGCAIDRTASAYTLTATDEADHLTAISQPFAVTVGDPAQLLFTAEPSGGQVGAAMATQPQVTIADAGGNPVTGAHASISLSLTAGTGASGAHLSCAATTRAATAGVASFSGCSVNTAAAGYTLTARTAGLTAELKQESLPFTIFAAPPHPLGQAPTGIPVGQTFGGKVYGANPTNVVDDVNTATGSLALTTTDLKVAGIGVPFLLRRNYNSADTTGGSFGPGWTSIFDTSLQVQTGRTATLRGDDGQQLVFTWDSRSRSWRAPAGAHATLRCQSNRCTVARFDGVGLTFALDHRGNGTLTDYVARNGRGLALSRFDWGILVTVDTTTRSLLRVAATLDGDGHITSVRTPAGRSVSYGYTGGLLTSFTDVDGHTWTYGYQGGKLTTQTDPLGQVRLLAGYDNAGRVTSVSRKGGPQHTDDTFAYDADSGTTTRMALTNVGGTETRVPYTDTYLHNVLVAQSTPDGTTTGYSYDRNVNLTQAQDPLGFVQQLGYDGDGNLVSQTIPVSGKTSATVKMTYNGVHQLTSQTDANGNTTYFRYTGANLTTIIPPTGPAGQIRLQYNRMGELITVSNAVSRQRFTYDGQGNRTGVLTDKPGPLGFLDRPLNGKGTLATFDEAGNLLSQTSARGTTIGPAASYTSTWSYNGNGNPTKVTDPQGNVTSYVYSAAGDMISATDPSGATTSYGWDEGTLTRTSTAGSGASTQVYDPSGHLLSQGAPTGGRTLYTLDAMGRAVGTTSPNGITVFQTYDAAANAVRTVDTAGNIVTRQFDTSGRQIRRVVNGAVTLTAYDLAGNVVSTTDPDGNVTSATYNPLSAIASITNSAGTTDYDYVANGDLKTVTSPNGSRTAYTYSQPGQVASKTVAAFTSAAGTTTYGYDVDGNLTTTTDPDGRVTRQFLDAAARPTKTVYTQGSLPSITVERAYDSVGRLQAMTDSTGTHTYSYDAAGNLTQVAGPQGTFGYDYTTTPGQITETYPDGTTIDYRVDDAGALMSLSSGTKGTDGYVAAAYLRDASRRTIGIALSNGVFETRQLDAQGNILGQALQNAGTPLADDAFTYAPSGNRLTQTNTVNGTQTANTYGYDGAGRLISFSTASTPASIVGPITPSIIAPDPTAGAGTGTGAPTPITVAGAPTPILLGGLPSLAPPFGGQQPAPVQLSPSTSAASIFGTRPNLLPMYGFPPHDQGQSDGFAHPPAPALPDSGTAYGYDRDGNRTSVATPDGASTSSYNARGELVSQRDSGGTTRYTYDRRGDVTQISGPSGTQAFTYDAAARLIAVTTTNSTGTTTVAYTYDGDGNRVSKSVTGPSGSATTKLVWDPAGQYPRLVLEQTGSGQLIRRYIYGEGPVAMQTPDATYFYHVDPAGSVAELTDADGKLVAAYHYAPFGEVTTETPVGAPAVDNPLLFQGEYLDSATGLYDLRARDYDPATGRFTQPEPMAIPPGVPATSPYAFAGDNPVTGADPTGQFSVLSALQHTFWGGSTLGANIATNARYGLTAAYKVGIPAYRAFAGAAEGAGEGGGAAGEAAGGAGDAAKIGGRVIAVAGFALQTYGTIEDCMHASAYQCAGDVVGETAAIVAYVACEVLTEGAGSAFVCGMVGAVISIALQQLVIAYGPTIVNGLISGYQAAAAAFDSAVGATTQFLSDTGDAITGFANRTGGAIVSGFNEATDAIASGFDTFASTLTDAGYTVAQAAELLADTFGEGVEDAVAGLIALGYDIEDVATALADQLGQTAEEAARILKDAYGYTVNEIAGALKDAYGLADAAAAAILQGIGYGAEQIAGALSDVYDAAADVAAGILKDLGEGLDEISAALQNAYDQAGAALATTLKALGYAANLVAGELRTLYNAIDSAAAAALAAAGYAVDQIVGALKDIFKDGAQIAAEILKGLDQAVDAIAGALNSVYGLLANGVAQILKNVGYLAGEVAGALKTVFEEADKAVAAALAYAGYLAGEVAVALQSVFSDAAAAAAEALKFAGYVINEIAGALKSVFNSIDSAVATILKDLGYAVNQVAAALQSVFNEAAAAVAGALKAAGYLVDQVVTALRDVFNQAADAVADILSDIGYTATQAAQALQDVFNLATSELYDALTDAGYAIADVAGEIGDTLESWGDSIADAASDAWDTFTSWF